MRFAVAIFILSLVGLTLAQLNTPRVLHGAFSGTYSGAASYGIEFTGSSINIGGGGGQAMRARLSSSQTNSVFNGGSLSGTNVVDMTVNSKATLLLSGGANNWLPTGAPDGSVLFMQYTQNPSDSYTAAIAVTVPFYVDATNSSFRIYSSSSLSVGNTVTPTFRYIDGTTQTTTQLGATCTVVANRNGDPATALTQNGGCAQLTGSATCSWTPTIVQCSKSGTYFNFLAPGPLEVSDSAFGGSGSTWAVVQRVRPYVVPDTTPTRPAGGALNISVTAYGVTDEAADDTCSGVSSAYQSGTCVMSYDLDKTTYATDFPGSASTGIAWGDAAPKYLSTRSPTVLFTTMNADGDVASNRPDRPGTVTIAVGYKYAYTLSSSSRVFIITLPTINTNISRVYPSIETFSIQTVPGNVAVVSASGWFFGFTATNVYLDVYWEAIPDTQTLGPNCNLGTVFGVTGYNTLNCSTPSTGLQRSGQAKLRVYAVRSGYTPDDTTTSAQLDVTPVVTGAVQNNAVIDYPSSGTLSNLAITGFALRGTTRVDSGTAAGTCSAGWTAVTNGTFLSCATFNLAPQAGTVSLTVSYSSTSIVTNIQTLRPVLTARNSNTTATITSFTMSGFGLGNSTGAAATVQFQSGALSVATAALFGSATVGTRVAAGTSATFTIDTGNRSRDAGAFYAVYTINGVSSTPVQAGNWNAVLVSTADTVNANVASTALSLAGWALGPSPVVTWTTSNAGVCNPSALSGSPGGSGYTYTCSYTTEPAAAGTYSAQVGTIGWRTAPTALRTYVPTVVATDSTQFVNASGTTFTLTGFGLGLNDAAVSSFTTTFDLGVSCNSVSGRSARVGTQGTITCTTSSFPNSGTVSITAMSVNSAAATGLPVGVVTVRPVVTAPNPAVTDITTATSTAIIISGNGLANAISTSLSSFSVNGVAQPSLTCASFAATGTQISCTLSDFPSVAGPLSATITVAGQLAGTFVIARYRPVITASTTNVLANASSITISGSGLPDGGSPSAVAFSQSGSGPASAVYSCSLGTVSSGSLTCTTSTAPTHGGNLFATVTVNGLTSNWAQVATIVPVWNIASPPNRNVLATTPGTAITVTGNGLCTGTSPTCNAPTVNIQAPFSSSPVATNPCGTISDASATGFTCTVSGAANEVGRVRATITAGAVSAASTLFFSLPVYSQNATFANVTASATSFSITSSNIGVSASITGVSITFAAVGGATTPTCSSVTIGSSFVACNSVAFSYSGPLRVTAFVATVAGETFTASQGATQVSYITPVLTTPSLTQCDYDNLGSGCSLTVNGAGLANAISMIEASSPSSGATFSAPSTVAAGTSITFNIAVGSPTRAGSVAVRVNAGGATGPASPVTVANIRPVVTAATPSLPSTAGPWSSTSWRFNVAGGPFSGTTTLALTGSATASCNVNSVTSLTCDLTARPTSAGTIRGTVTTNGVTANAAADVASVAPVIDELPRVQGNFIPIDSVNPVLTVTGWSLGTSFSMSVSGLDCTSFSTATLIGAGDTTNKQRVTCTITTMPSLAGAYNVSSYTGNSVSNVALAGYTPAVAYFHPVIDSSSVNTNWNVETDRFFVSGRGFVSPSTLTLASGVCQSVNVASSTSLECVVGTADANKPANAGPLGAQVGSVGLTAPGFVNAVTVIPYISSITFSPSATSWNITQPPTRIIFAGLALNSASGVAVSSNGISCGVFSRSATSFQCGNTSVPVRATAPGPISMSIWGNSGQYASATFAVSSGFVLPVVDAAGASIVADSASFTIVGHGLNCGGTRTISLLNGGSCTLGTAPGPYSFGNQQSTTCSLSAANRIQRHGPLRVTFDCDGATSAVGVPGTVVPVVFPNPQQDPWIYPITSLPAGIGSTTFDGIALFPPSGSDVTSNVVLQSGRGISCSSASAAVVDTTRQRITCTFAASGTPNGPGAFSAQVGVTSFLSSAANIFYVAPSINSQTTLYGQSALSLSFQGYGLNVLTSDMQIIVRTVRVDTTQVNSPCTPVSITNALPNPSIVSCSFQAGTKREAGTATIFVTAANVTGQPVQVATITFDPEVSNTQSSTILAVNAPRFNILGRNFANGGNRNLAVALTLSNAQASPYTCSVEFVNDTVITCVFRSSGGFPSGTSGSPLGLIATVTRNDGAGTATQLFNLVPRPNITALSDGILFNTTTIRLAGTNLGSSATSDIRATLSLGGQNRTCLPASAGSNCIIRQASTGGTYLDLEFTPFTVNPPYEPLYAEVVRALGPTDYVQVRSLGYAPSVDSSTEILSTLADRMTLTGSNFYAPNPERNIVILSSGQCVPLSATPTQLVCQILGTPLPPGPLSVLTITSNGIRGTGAQAQVRTVLSVPVIFASTRGIQRGSLKMSYSVDPVVPDNTLVIRGSGFSTNAAALSVTLTAPTPVTPAGVSCTVNDAKSSYITCLTDTTFSTLGPVYATVSRDQLNSGTPIQIGTVRDLPTVRQSSAVISDVATVLLINGTGLSSYAPEDNIVSFNQSGVFCVPLASTDISITCRLVGRLSVGVLGARVQVDDLVQTGTDFTPVATIVLNPDIVASTRSIATGTRNITVTGQGFVSSAGAITVQTTSGACAVTVVGSTMLFCVLPSPPAAGTVVYATSICAGTVCNAFATSPPIATIRNVPTVTSGSVPIITSPPDSLTLSILGTGFSTVPSENQVVLSSGTCTVASDPPPTATQIICIVNPFDFRAGLLTAQVTVLGGVTSTVQPLLVYTPQFPTLTAERKIPINADELILPGYYFTEITADILQVNLTRAGVPAASCQIIASTRTSVTCRLSPNKFDKLGDFEVALAMNITDSTTTHRVFTTPRSLAGTVVPVVFDNEYEAPSGSGFNSSIQLFGAGFRPNQATPVVDIVTDTGKKRAVGDQIACYVEDATVTADSMNCTLVVPDNQKAGDFFVTVAVRFFDAVSGVEDVYTSPQSLLVSIFPVVNPPTPREFRTDGFTLTFTGVGLSDNPDEVTVTLVPGGTCQVISATPTQIVCQVQNGTVVNGPLEALVGIRGVFYPPNLNYPRLNLGNVTLDYVDAPVQAPGAPIASNDTLAPETVLPPSDNGAIKQTDPGIVAAIIIGILLGVALVVIIIWIVVGYRRYGSVKEAFTGPFSGGQAAAYKGGRAPRKRAVFRARETAITPPYNAPVKATPGAGQDDDDVPPPPPPEDDDDAPPPPPEDDDDDAPPPPPEDDDGTTFEMQRFGTLRVNPEEIFAMGDDAPPPPPEDSSDSESAPPAPESSDSSEESDAPPPPADEDPFAADAPVGGDIDVDNIFD
eukprot:TRINITY_DN3206_c0_g1_i3.p1 TRINITY_DN3206_c0_g1~~TRINITY_DN3206_c0_g1_i3.p1  ORF type:complete len:3275 (+),score=688.30 TRINITY_DN3206_c0_g1_i3:353-10177(+)